MYNRVLAFLSVVLMLFAGIVQSDIPTFHVASLPPCGDDPLGVVKRIAVTYGIAFSRIGNIVVNASSTNGGCPNVSFQFTDDAVSYQSPYNSAAALSFYLSTLQYYAVQQVLIAENITWSNGSMPVIPEPVPSVVPTPVPFPAPSITFTAQVSDSQTCNNYQVLLASFLMVEKNQVFIVKSTCSDSPSLVMFNFVDGTVPSLCLESAVVALNGTISILAALNTTSLEASRTISSPSPFQYRPAHNDSHRVFFSFPTSASVNSFITQLSQTDVDISSTIWTSSSGDIVFSLFNESAQHESALQCLLSIQHMGHIATSGSSPSHWYIWAIVGGVGGVLILLVVIAVVRRRLAKEHSDDHVLLNERD